MLPGHEDIFVRHCKAAMTYHLRTQGNLRVVQQEVYQDADPHDVRLVYDAQDPSGPMVRGDFRCLYVPGGGGSSNFDPRFSYIEVNGLRLTANERLMLEANIVDAIDRNR